MGLDIYAGTLTRYYSHNWKTVVQQWAEENGYTFNRIAPDGESADDGEELSPAEVQAAVENWRDQILSAISQTGPFLDILGRSITDVVVDGFVCR